jgi:hypothetical protein
MAVRVRAVPGTAGTAGSPPEDGAAKGALATGTLWGGAAWTGVF